MACIQARSQASLNACSDRPVTPDHSKQKGRIAALYDSFAGERKRPPSPHIALQLSWLAKRSNASYP